MRRERSAERLGIGALGTTTDRGWEAPHSSRGAPGLHDFAVLLDEVGRRGRRADSSTASEGRQRRVPFGVSTIGRLIRIGWASMASMSASSVQ